jgi:Retrotransposon gag protein
MAEASSEYTIDPNDLTIDELEYELCIRGLVVVRNRRNNCISLRRALLGEQTGARTTPAFPEYLLEYRDELVAVQEKIDELFQVVSDAETSDNAMLKNQLKSRFSHLVLRFRRINPDQVNVPEFSEAARGIEQLGHRLIDLAMDRRPGPIRRENPGAEQLGRASAGADNVQIDSGQHASQVGHSTMVAPQSRRVQVRTPTNADLIDLSMEERETTEQRFSNRIDWWTLNETELNMTGASHQSAHSMVTSPESNREATTPDLAQTTRSNTATRTVHENREQVSGTPRIPTRRPNNQIPGHPGNTFLIHSAKETQTDNQLPVQRLNFSQAAWAQNNATGATQKVPSHLATAIPQQQVQFQSQQQFQSQILQKPRFQPQFDPQSLPRTRYLTNDYSNSQSFGPTDEPKQFQTFYQPNKQFHSQTNYPPANYSVTSGESRRRGEVFRWRISFKGDETGLSLNDFLSQAEDLSVAAGMSPNDLRHSMIHLLEGSALIWYRAFNHNYQTWEDLKTALRREYLPFDYEHFLRQDIEQRTQGNNEPFSTFLASMELLFRKLSRPPPESEKIEILRRNMNPELAKQLSIYEIFSTEQLGNIVKHWERFQFVAKRRSEGKPVEPAYFAEPVDRKPKREVRRVMVVDASDSESEEEFDLEALQQALRQIKKSRPPKKTMSETASEANTKQEKVPSRGAYPRARQDKGTDPSEGGAGLVCWNCDTAGHGFRDCTLPRTGIFCFFCGLKDTTTARCSRCKTSGNATGTSQ